MLHDSGDWMAVIGTAVVAFFWGKAVGYSVGQADERKRIKERWRAKAQSTITAPEDLVSVPGARIPSGMEAMYEADAKKLSAKARKKLTQDIDGEWMDED